MRFGADTRSMVVGMRTRSPCGPILLATLGAGYHTAPPGHLRSSHLMCSHSRGLLLPPPGPLEHIPRQLAVLILCVVPPMPVCPCPGVRSRAHAAGCVGVAQSESPSYGAPSAAQVRRQKSMRQRARDLFLGWTHFSKARAHL